MISLFPGVKKQLEEQETIIENLRASNEQLKIEKEKIEALAKTKSNFLSTMSHEIRTQLNAISGMTFFLSEESPRPDQQKHIDILKFASESLRTLVNDILDFNKISAGKVVFEYLNFNIPDLQNVVVESVRQKALSNLVELNSTVDPDIPKRLIGDPVRLGQVLTNLMSNAVKFTKNGKVDFSIDQLKETKDTVILRFSVADNGIGIEKTKLKEIFNAFTQASTETTRKFGGTGLGLTISKKLLELQGSDLKVESQLGVGSTFSFEMTFQKGGKTEILKTPVPYSQTGESLQGIKLLLAEDNKINQMVARKFLTKWGIIFDLAEDGMKALEMATDNHYDIILMDLNMPLMNGYTVTKKLRKLQGKGVTNLPIIALTASAMKEEKSQVFEVGMNSFVTKPFNPEQLFFAIKNQLDKKEIMA